MSDAANALASDEQKVSYGFGLQFGQQLIRNTFAGLDADVVAMGIKDILEENKIQVTEEELNNAYANVQRIIQEEQTKKAKQMAELSQTFLAENAKRDGVSVTDSGLQYEVLEAGTGAKPDTSSSVKVHYHGTFMDGTVFDSSVERGEPAEFGVTQVIKGWTEALQLMETGSKWRLVIPSNLAYGDAGAPPSIPGGAVLVFEVHLIDIV
jgi:FKBP-type peptidyl-prolyl cis-trans isomerase FklB